MFRDIKHRIECIKVLFFNKLQIGSVGKSLWCKRNKTHVYVLNSSPPSVSFLPRRLPDTPCSMSCIISFCLMTVLIYLLIYHMLFFLFFLSFFPLSVMSGKSQCHHPSPYITALTATGSCQKHHPPSTFHLPTNQLGCHRQR